MEKPPDPRLAVLTGEAIKLMVEAGATAEVVGHFAVHYPAMVAAKLEPLPPPQEVDLESLVRMTVQNVLAQGFGVRVSAGEGEMPMKGAPRGGRDERKKINVLVGGRKTSVKLRAGLYQKLAALQGPMTVEARVQGFVDSTPAGHANRSAWVEQQALQLLVLSEMSPETTPGH